MKKIMITGALGQIGSELTRALRAKYGAENVIATNNVDDGHSTIPQEGPFELLDVVDYSSFLEIAKRYEVDTLIHLAALLSAVAEARPQLAWKINMDGTINALEVARELQLLFFTPSSIGAFGPSTPKDMTPQVTIQRPTTMYGVNKVSGELLCDYYHERFGVDTRGVRFPGLISYLTPPGGGTTDYAIEICYEAVQKRRYECPLAADTRLDMMYMPDAIKAIIDLLEVDGANLIHRNAFNISSMSFTPEEIATEIRQIYPDFEMSYNIDPILQKIADSWPNSLDSTCAKEEWGFSYKYDLHTMLEDMFAHISTESVMVKETKSERSKVLM